MIVILNTSSYIYALIYALIKVSLQSIFPILCFINFNDNFLDFPYGWRVINYLICFSSFAAKITANSLLKFHYSSYCCCSYGCLWQTTYHIRYKCMCPATAEKCKKKKTRIALTFHLGYFHSVSSKVKSRKHSCLVS